MEANRPHVAALRLGVPVQFLDRWQGRVVAIEVDEQWEALNLVIRRGVLRWTSSVRLPFSSSPRWSDDGVAFDCTSAQAFGRQLPPIAAPARPLSRATPLSLAGAGLVGLLVERSHRVATDIIIRQRTTTSRVPVEDTSFEGKLLHIATHGEEPRPYIADAELEVLARDAIATSRALTGDERRAVSIDAEGGVITVRGNVLTQRARQALGPALFRFSDAAVIRLETIDDQELELAIGLALEREGFTHTARVYARASLGHVTLYGEAPSQRAAEDIARAVSHVPGVRSVRSLLNIRRTQPAARA
jgi:hypothetical protein